MKVSELLQGMPCTGTYNDVEVLDVTQDSRLVEPGYLFVCIKGASLMATPWRQKCWKRAPLPWFVTTIWGCPAR